MPIMLAIVDPCYHKIGGHHHGVNRRLVGKLQYLKPVLYADKGIDINAVAGCYPAGVLQPWFEDLGYIPATRYDTLQKLLSVSRCFAQALRSVDARIVIAHTLLHFHLYGLALALHGKSPITLVVSVMFSPYEGLRADQDKLSLDYHYTRLAFALLNRAAGHGGHSITVVFTSEYHYALYQGIRNACPFLAFDRAPWLVGLHNLGQESEPLQQRRDTVSIGLYFGDAKEEKGIFRLKQLISHLNRQAASGKTLALHRLTFCLSFGSVDSWLVPVVDEILAMCAQNPRLYKVDHGYLKDADYCQWIEQMDAVAFLYDPVQYRMRSSGLFYDVISFCYVNHQAKAILVPASSWMEAEARLLGVNAIPVDLRSQAWMDDLLAGCQRVRARSDFAFQCDDDLLQAYAGQSFADWVAARPAINNWQMIVDGARAASEQHPLLIASTQYSHFTSLSGPTGFVNFLSLPYLPIQTGLGQSSAHAWIRDYAGLRSATDDAQDFERHLLRCTDLQDWLLLCVDGEHLGSLLARSDALAKERKGKRILAWFHQPVSILRRQCIDPERFSIQALQPLCISPCQRSFFVEALGLEPDDVPVIPHGVHSQLLSLGLRSASAHRAHDSDGATPTQVRFLIVGSWLRDRALIFHVAKELPQHQFTWISAGMRLSEQEARLASRLPNLEIIDKGISNARLHAYYHHSDCLFQPLLDATANNAILEAMCFSLPIITSDLPGTRWYTANHAMYYNSNGECLDLLVKIASYCKEERLQLAQPLRQRVSELDWRVVAEKFRQALANVLPESDPSCLSSVIHENALFACRFSKNRNDVSSVFTRQ